MSKILTPKGWRDLCSKEEHDLNENEEQDLDEIMGLFKKKKKEMTGKEYAAKAKADSTDHQANVGDVFDVKTKSQVDAIRRRYPNHKVGTADNKKTGGIRVYVYNRTPKAGWGNHPHPKMKSANQRVKAQNKPGQPGYFPYDQAKLNKYKDR